MCIFQGALKIWDKRMLPYKFNSSIYTEQGYVPKPYFPQISDKTIVYTGEKNLQVKTILKMHVLYFVSSVYISSSIISWCYTTLWQ